MNTEHKKLLAIARKAARNTYSPYSKFPVGAALMTAEGKVFSGCNVENASYGLTMCAERVAMLKAVSEGNQKFKALAVVGGCGKAARPCGACLQVLAEFCGPDFPVCLASLDKPGRIESLTLGDLLPHAFKL
jgi:cytidine deaminase